MDKTKAKEILDAIVTQVFGYKNPFTLEQFMKKYAFDVELPQPVKDAGTGEITWTHSTNPTKFMRFDHIIERAKKDDWYRPPQSLQSIKDVLTAWDMVNLTATEWEIDSTNYSESDNLYESENIYRSQDIDKCQNILFCDGLRVSNFLAASQRNVNCHYCVRAEDSDRSSNCFSISRCSKVSNSLFMHNCQSMQDSLFCSHINGKRFYIANMPFEEAEYLRIKKMVVNWILTAN